MWLWSVFLRLPIQDERSPRPLRSQPPADQRIECLRWGLAFLPLYADANLAIYDLAVPKFAGGRDRRLRTCPDLAPLLALLARQWSRER